MAELKLDLLTFDQIKEVWETKLWPGRTSAIEPISLLGLTKDGGSSLFLDTTILGIKQEPFFVGVRDGERLVGVNSGFLTGAKQYRSRGLYIDPEYRGQGIAKMLLREVIIEALYLDCSQIWSMPRQGALHAYLAAGFKQTTDWFEEGVEFGPNCFVTADPWDNRFVRSAQ